MALGSFVCHISRWKTDLCLHKVREEEWDEAGKLCAFNIENPRAPFVSYVKEGLLLAPRSGDILEVIWKRNDWKLQAHVDKVVILKGGGEFLVKYEGRVEDRKITLEPGDPVILGSNIQFEIFDKLLPANGNETQKKDTPLAINEQTLEWIQLGLGLGGIIMSLCMGTALIAGCFKWSCTKRQVITRRAAVAVDQGEARRQATHELVASLTAGRRATRTQRPDASRPSRSRSGYQRAVSYTHLTLPTIYSV